MDNLAREQLRELVARFGRGLIDDPRRVESLLRDACPGQRREVSVLAGAARERVPADLLSSSQGLPKAALVARLQQRLEENLALAPDAARWAVESWGLALGILAAADLRPSAGSSPPPQGGGPPPAPRPAADPVRAGPPAVRVPEAPPLRREPQPAPATRGGASRLLWLAVPLLAAVIVGGVVVAGRKSGSGSKGSGSSGSSAACPVIGGVPPPATAPFSQAGDRPAGAPTSPMVLSQALRVTPFDADEVPPGYTVFNSYGADIGSTGAVRLVVVEFNRPPCADFSAAVTYDIGDSAATARADYEGNKANPRNAGPWGPVGSTFPGTGLPEPSSCVLAMADEHRTKPLPVAACIVQSDNTVIYAWAGGPDQAANQAHAITFAQAAFAHLQRVRSGR